MSHVLIVEDEEHLAKGLAFNLGAEGHDVTVREHGEVALELLADPDHRLDLVLLDAMLPGIDGFEVLRRLRQSGNFVPVIMVTARGQKEDVLRGFEAGADDYVPKPFELPILLARVQGLLRRTTWRDQPSTQATSKPTPVCLAGRRIDLARRVVERDATSFPLTVMEADLLGYLMRHEGQAVSRQALLEDVWGVRKDTDTRTIDNFIARLRRVVEDDPSSPRYLQTVRGIGYRFVADPLPGQSG